jgi:fermentation-respiration switch protein FrsA (DUF1100 family)
VLLVTGTDDASAPRWMTDRIEAAAPGPVALLVMQGAQHGHYAQAPGGPAYLERVGAFLEECLAVPDGGLVAP